MSDTTAPPFARFKCPKCGSERASWVYTPLGSGGICRGCRKTWRLPDEWKMMIEPTGERFPSALHYAHARERAELRAEQARAERGPTP